MEQTALEEKVYALVARAAAAKAAGVALCPEVSLRRDLGLDSLGLSTLLVTLGEALGKDPDDLIDLLADAPLDTVGDLVALGGKIVGVSA